MAEVGKWAKYSVTGLAAPTTTPSTIDFTEVTDTNNIVTRKSAGVYNVDEAGVYAIDATGIFNDTSNGRHNPVWDITLNGVVVAGSPGSGYNRNSANKFAWTRAGAILDLAVTDEFSIRHYRDTDAPTGTYDQATFRASKVAATGAPVSHAGTPASAAYGGTTPTRVTGWNAISESDTAAIQITTNGVTLKNSRYYLFFTSMVNSDVGGARTGRMLSTLFDAGAVEHAQGQAFQRDANNQYAFPNTWGLVKGDGTGQLLEFLLHAHTSPITPNWSDGSWVLSAAANAAGFMIVELDAGAAAAIYADATGGQTISTNATLDLNVFRTIVNEDAPFSRVSNTAVDVTVATEIFGWAAVSTQRTVAATTRLSNAGRFVVETVAQADTEYGDYVRGDNWPDHWNCALGSSLVKSLAINDTINFQKFDPITDDGSNDFSITGGAFFVDLGTLIAGIQIITIGAATETETPQPVAATKQITVTAVAEAETPQPVTSVKISPIVAVTESELATTITASKLIITAIGAVTETESAQVIKSFIPFVSCGLPFTLPRVLPTCELVGPTTVVIGAATEAEVVAAVQAGKAVTITAATETEVAGMVGAAKLATVGSVAETEAAQVVAPVKPIVAPITPATETELARPVDPVKVITVTVGAVSEAEVAQQIAATKTSPIGTPSETEVAQVVAPLKPITVAVGAGTETETAQVVAPVIARVVAIGVVTETETAQPIAAVKPIIVAVTAVTETEAAAAIPATKQHTISAVTGTESAQLISASKTVTVTPATETETAELVGAVKDITVAIGAATETEVAQPVTALIANLIAIGAATETEAAQIVAVLKPIITTVGAATETELAYVITVVTSAGVLKFVIASVTHPSATITVTYPTGAGTVSHPTGAAVVSHPDADADVSHPAAVGSID